MRAHIHFNRLDVTKMWIYMNKKTKDLKLTRKYCWKIKQGREKNGRNPVKDKKPIWQNRGFCVMSLHRVPQSKGKKKDTKNWQKVTENLLKFCRRLLVKVPQSNRKASLSLSLSLYLSYFQQVIDILLYNNELIENSPCYSTGIKLKIQERMIENDLNNCKIGIEKLPSRPQSPTILLNWMPKRTRLKWLNIWKEIVLQCTIINSNLLQIEWIKSQRNLNIGMNRLTTNIESIQIENFLFAKLLYKETVWNI